MKKLWIRRDMEVENSVVWDLLTDLDCWHHWGPSVRDARLDGESFQAGATGTVTTVLGVELPFEITSYSEGERWAWKVLGVPATDHTVEPLGSDRCRVSFGVPWPAGPYGVVCRLALGRIETMASERKRRNS